MNIKQRAIVGTIVVAGFTAMTAKYPDKNDSYGLTKDDINNIIIETQEGFISAEQQILEAEPDPVIIPDEPQGPDPDVNKCICKGTGKILQGDGHVTPCPYHSVRSAQCDCGCEKEDCNCEECVKIAELNQTQTRNKGILRGFSGRSN